MGSGIRRRGSPALVAAAAAAFTVAAPNAVASPHAAQAQPPRGERTALTISPQPGTPDVSPTTQISILGVPPARIGSVTVAGSASGRHPGALHPYSAHRGASFVLSQALTQGERVNVRIEIRGHRTVALAFTVAHLAKIPPVINLPAQQPDKLDHFVSRPELLPPHVTILKHGMRTGGDIFLAPLPSPIVHPQSNNAIFDQAGRPGRPDDP